MKGQRGSALAGVIGLAVGLTSAVAGFAVLAGNSGRIVADAQADAQLHLAAESGIYMGLRWLRTYPNSVTKYPESDTDPTLWPTTPKTINTGSPGWADFEGVQVKVRFYATPGEFQRHQFQCLATYGPGRDTLEIKLYFTLTDESAPEAYGGTTLYKLAVARWTETLHPAFP